MNTDYESRLEAQEAIRSGRWDFLGQSIVDAASYYAIQKYQDEAYRIVDVYVSREGFVIGTFKRRHNSEIL